MQPRQVITLGNFFAATHFFLIIFILGPYLATFLAEEEVGLVIAFGAIITLFTFPLMPRLVRDYGTKKLAIILAALQAIVLSVLAGNPAPAIAVIAVALVCAIAPFISYQLDLLLESTVREEGATGRIRTAFLTVANIALVLAPLAVGALLNGTDRYDFVFFAAAVSLTPFIMLFLVEHLPEGEAPRTSKLAATCVCIVNNKDLRAVALAQSVLQFFFHLAPLYVPLYLHNALGIPWSDLGWVFAVMLIPFVFVEYPAGWLADKYLGDRELLIAGFAITGISTALLAFVTASTPLLFIMLILLGTRIGAALCEAMIEGHFFRRVNERDANTISVYRMMRPAGALVAPIVGSIILVLSGYGMLFLIAGGAVAILGIMSARTMQDIL